MVGKATTWELTETIYVRLCEHLLTKLAEDAPAATPTLQLTTQVVSLSRVVLDSERVRTMAKLADSTNWSDVQDALRRVYGVEVSQLSACPGTPPAPSGT